MVEHLCQPLAVEHRPDGGDHDLIDAAIDYESLGSKQVVVLKGDPQRKRLHVLFGPLRHATMVLDRLPNAQ
jgi:hypothetical protein